MPRANRLVAAYWITYGFLYLFGGLMVFMMADKHFTGALNL